MVVPPPTPPMPSAAAARPSTGAHGAPQPGGAESRRTLRSLADGGFPDKDTVIVMAKCGPAGSLVADKATDQKDGFQLRTSSGGGCITVYHTGTVHCGGTNLALSIQMVAHFTDQNTEPARKRKKHRGQ